MITIVISLISLVISGCSLWLSLRNQRPILTKHILFKDSLEGESGLSITAEMRNHGLGPALFQSFELFVDGKGFAPEKSHLDGVHQAIVAAFADSSLEPQIRQTCWPGKGEGFVMKTGEQLVIAQLFFPGMTKVDVVKTEEPFKRIDWRIVFKSTHGVRQVFDTRNEV